MANNCAKIFGIEQDLLEEFVILIRDKWGLADKANYLLEQDAGISGIMVAITNQRDAISHFVTFLSDLDKATPDDVVRDFRKAQISAAKEHLRRAVMESYQIAVTTIVDKTLPLIVEYRQKVLPLNDPALADAPDLKEVYKMMARVSDLLKEGRKAKIHNIWNENWEEGIQKFVEAFEGIKNIKETLDDYITKANKIQNNRTDQIKAQLQTLSEILGVSVEYLQDASLRVKHGEMASVILPNGKIENPLI